MNISAPRLLVITLCLAMCHTPFAMSSSFAGEMDDDIPLTAVGGKIHVDEFTGTATTSIPIEVPPGRNGMQPNLALTYASSGGNGWVGMGWKLEVGTIERQTRWGVLYNPTPQEETDGKVYTMRLNGVSTDLVKAPAPAPSNEYRAKIEGAFLRIRLMNSGLDGWEVTDKKGTKYIFGKTYRIQSGTMIFKWCLEKVIDRDGNYMSILYVTDQGQGYLDQIQYGGNDPTGVVGGGPALPHTNMVKFYTESRPDAPVMYTSNFPITTAKRLKTIAVWSDLAMTKLVRVYSLQYSGTGSVPRSILTAVQQFGKDAGVNTSGIVSGGTALPAVSISPISAAAEAMLGPQQDNAPAQSANFYGTWADGTSVGDVNGDGRADVLFTRASVTQNFGTRVYVSLSNGDGTFGPIIQSNPDTAFNYAANQSADRTLVADVNGDGRADVIWTRAAVTENFGTRAYVSLANADGTFGPIISSAPDTAYNYYETWADGTAVGDVNGDGLPDLIFTQVSVSRNYGVRIYVALADGTGHFGSFAGHASAPALSGNYFANSSADQTRIADVNGDGRADVLFIRASVNGNFGTRVYVALANADGTYQNLIQSSPAVTGNYFLNSYADNILVGDINGDGRADVLFTRSAITENFGTRVYASLANADGTFGPIIQSNPAVSGNYFANVGADGTSLGDVNGDGRVDVVFTRAAKTEGFGTRVYVSLSNGDGTFQPIIDNAPAQAGNYFLNSGADTTIVGDINGNGSSDVLFTRAAVTENFGTRIYVSRSNVSSSIGKMQSISNGLGGNTTISYTPSPQLTTSQTRLPYPVQVVTSLTTNDGNGNVATTNYGYAGGFHHIGERDFRGFNQVTVTSPTGPTSERTTTVTQYHQGNDPLVDVNNPNVANGYLKGRPYRVLVKNESNVTQVETLTEYYDDVIDGSNVTAPFFTPVKKVTTNTYVNGAVAKQSRVTYTYGESPQYGNLTKEEYEGDLVVTGDEKTIERTYTTLDATNWIVGLPLRQTTYAGIAPMLGVKLDETVYSYDLGGSCTTPAGTDIPTKGHVTKVIRLLTGGTNPISGMEYDAYGNLTCTRDPKGNRTTLTYDPTKIFALTGTNALNHLTTTVYYGVNGEPIPTGTGFFGRVKSVTDPNGRVLSYQYDALGRKTQAIALDSLQTQWVYNYPGTIGSTQYVQTTSSGANLATSLVAKTYFDGLGRTIKKVSSGPTGGNNVVVETRYNVRGQVLKSSLPYFETTENPDSPNRWRVLAYDALGRTTQVTEPNTSITSKLCYSGWQTATLDKDGHLKRETRDAFGRTITVEEFNNTGTLTTCTTMPGVTPYVTQYTYDPIGRLTKVVDVKLNETRMTYDTLGRKLTMHDPDMGDWSYQYDANGNLTKQTDAKAQVLWFQYDELNRRRQKDFGGAAPKTLGSGDVVYTYEPGSAALNQIGRLKQRTDASGTVTYQYDNAGRINRTDKVLDGTTYTTSSTYDGLGRPTQVLYPTSPVKGIDYTYTGPWLDKVKDRTGDGTTQYVAYAGYNALGQPSTATYGSGAVTTYTYQMDSYATCPTATQRTYRLCTLKTQKGANPVLQDLTYAFTPGGNVTQLTDTVNGNQSFGYDELDRLATATGPYGSGGATSTFTYTYNEIGNLTSNTQVGSYTYPASGATSVRPHAVSTAGSNGYGYDANGNMTSGAGRTLAYTFENKPSSITLGGQTTTFVYDGDTTRVKKIVGTTTTRYINQYFECDNTNCSRYIWAGSARIATIATNGTVNYWHQDHLGSSAVITDNAGAKVENLAYFPYGGTRTNTSTTTPATDVPYKFTGQELDSSTGLYDYVARQYDAPLARFISPDTIVPNPRDPQALNRYAYVRNNPLRYNDPSGHDWGDGFFDCWFGCDDDEPPPPPPTVNQVVEQFHLPTVNNFIDQTVQSVMGYGREGESARLGLDPQSLMSQGSGPSVLARLGDAASGLLVPGWIYTAITGELPFSGEKVSGIERALPFVALASEIRSLGRAADALDAAFASGRSSEAALQHLESILKPGGNLIGVAGSSPDIRIVVGGQRAAEDLILNLGEVGRLGRDIKNGFLIDVQDLGTLTYRYGSQSGGPAINVKIQGLEDISKIHFK